MSTRKQQSAQARNVGRVESPLHWLGLKQAAAGHLLGLIFAVLGSGLTVVYLSFQNRTLFNELQQLRDQANELNVQWGQLLIEQSTFGLEGRIEQKAVETLELKIPQVDRIVMVQNE